MSARIDIRSKKRELLVTKRTIATLIYRRRWNAVSTVFAAARQPGLEIEMSGGDDFAGDAPAIAFGCIAGLIGGAGFGVCVVLLLGGFSSDMWMFVMLHSMLAMMVMGGWTAPSLMPPSKK